jgi:small subunit ribosomal protein S20
LANSAQARKRARQADKHRAHNVALRSRMRTAAKKVIKAIESGDTEAATAAFKSAAPVIDGSVSKGLIHKNKAARDKSRMNAKIKAMSA